MNNARRRMLNHPYVESVSVNMQHIIRDMRNFCRLPQDHCCSKRANVARLQLFCRVLKDRPQRDVLSCLPS